MDDLRYSLVPSDDKTLGDWMIVRERIRDWDNRVLRDHDFFPRYFIVQGAAENELDKLNAELLKNG